MGTVYSFCTIASDLLVNDPTTLDDIQNVWLDNDMAVNIAAETKNWDNWVEETLVRLSYLASSGELVVIKQSEDGAMEFPPMKFVVTPRRVTVHRSHIVWEEGVEYG